jgi:transposase
MTTLFLGVDVSKGYADLCFQNEAGSILTGSQRYDDTPAGHAAVRQAVEELQTRVPGSLPILVGIESSGGLERNWLRFFKSLSSSCRVYQLNPLAVKRFLDRELHRNITDPLSAAGIAAYLREGMRRADRQHESADEGLRVLYRFACNFIRRAAEMQNELQSLLPAVHPDLVSHCRQGIPKSVLQLLARYPTVSALKRASTQVLARIPFITEARAATFVAEAKTSVAALRDPHTGVAVSEMANELLRMRTKIASLKAQLVEGLPKDRITAILTSIPGIGLWTAVCLRLELGAFDRFHSDAAIVAYAGLDPKVHKSGDGEVRSHISRRGRPQIRAALHMAAITALRVNPTIAEFYARLRSQGKEPLEAITACAAKLLRIAYACVVSDQAFDPARHHEVAQRHARAEREAVAAPAPVPHCGSLDAPVSQREAKRRRAAAVPQAGVPRRERGPGAALTPHDRPAHPMCQPVPTILSSQS